MNHGKRIRGERRGMGGLGLLARLSLVATVFCLACLLVVPLAACFNKNALHASASQGFVAEDPSAGAGEYIPAQDLLPAADETRVTTKEITELITPLTGGFDRAHWSPINLITVIASAILLLIFIIRVFFDRPRESKYKEETVDAEFLAAMSPEKRAQYEQKRIDSYHAWLAVQQKHACKRKVIYVNFAVLTVATLCVIEAIVMLYLTQDFTAQMVVIDNLSPLFILILFVQALAAIAAAQIYNNKVENRQHEQRRTRREQL